MADLSGMVGTIDAAPTQGAPPPGGMPSPAPRGTSASVQGFVGSIDSALRQGASGAASGGSSGYQRTADLLNAALAPDAGSAQGRDDPSTVTVQNGPTYGHTLAALNAALNTPAGTRIIMGAAPTAPAGLTPQGDAQPDAGSVQPPDGMRALTIRGGQAAEPAPQSDAPNPSGPLSNAPDDGWLSSAAKGTATGLIKGAGDAVGFVGGLGGLADYLIARGESAVTGKPVEDVMAAHAARRKAVEADMGKDPLGRLAVATDPTNLLPSPDDVSGPVLQRIGAYQPTSEVGRLAQAGVEAVPAMLGPGGGMVSPGTAGKALAGALARQAPAMALGGAASQGAVDATGSPLAGLAAGLAAPALAEGGIALGRGGLATAGKLLAPIAGGSDRLNNAPVIGPALQAGREAAVAQKLVGQASDPAALKAWAASQPEAADVPGSPRTLAGAVGSDPGLFDAEKAARNVSNARPTSTVTVDGRTYGGQSFNGIDRAQSDAQLAALQSSQAGADVFRPGQMIRDRMDAIEAAAQQAEDRLNAAHADAVQSTTQAGQAFASDQQSALAQRAADRTQAGLDFAAGQRSDLADREAARVQAAADDKLQGQSDRDDAHQQLVQGFADARARQTEAAQAAAGGLGQPVDDDSLGGTLRGAVEQVRAGAKDLHRQLYKAVDPDGTLAMVASPIGDAAQRIQGQLQTNGADLSAVEAPLFRRAAALPDVATYGTVHQLDTDLSAAMSAERRSAGETPAWARLSQLKGAVKGAMTNAADNQAAHEARLVQAGVMAPEDTIAARLGQDFDAVRPTQRPEAGRATGTADRSGAGLGASGDPGTPGEEVSRRGGPGASAGGPGLQADAGREDEASPLTVRPDRPPAAADASAQPAAPAQPRPADAASPFDMHVSPDVAKSLGTGTGRGTTQEAANGDTYLLNSVDRDASGQHSTRWVNLGPESGLSDTIEALRSISGVKDDTPLGAASRAMSDIYRRMGVGDTPTFSVAPEHYEKLSFTGRGSNGIYNEGSRRIFLQADGSAEQQLQTAVHEGAHAAFNDMVKSNPEVAANVEALQRHANAPAFREAWRQTMGGGPENDVSYGLQFKSEFLTEAFSNPKVQQYLSRIPAPPELVKRLGIGQSVSPIRTAWDAFKATMARAFGIAPTADAMSMLDATIGYAGKISEGSAERAAVRGEGQNFSMRGDDSAPREVGAGPRPDAPAFDPDGLRAPAKPDMPRPQDLRAFVKSRGGMRDTGGDLAAMGMPELIGKGPRAVDPDKMREAAAEAGYLGADTARAMRETHPNDLLDALSGDRPVHSVRDEDAAAAWAAHDEARERYDAARGEFGTRSRFGVVPERAPLDSYSREDIEGPGGPQMRELPSSGLQPNFGAEAAGRLKAANAAYADYARTYKNPIVGPGLRTTGFSGDYQRGDAAFIRSAVKTGPQGYENAKAHLLAAKNDPEAVDAMHDAVLNPLRRAALGPGFLPPAALANWKASYGPVLRALDEVTPGFSARFDDAGRATQELLDMGAEHTAAAKAAQKEAARQAVLDDADRRTRLGQANAADRDAVSNLLAERKANDRADAASDKASTSAAIARRADADRDALGRSKDETAEGVGRARDILREARATPAAQFAAKGGIGVASTEVENAVGSYLRTGTGGATRMRGLVQSVQDNPEALDGLRKAGTDWLVRTHTNADGSLSGAKLIGFLKDNVDTLRELYPHDQVSMMGAVARDAEAGARWRTTTAVKGGSDSVKNLLAAAAEGHGKGGHVTLGIVATEAVMQGFEHGGMMGAATGGAGAAALYMLNSMRQAGIRRTSDLYMAALADPELARALISKMPNSPTAGPVTLFARQLRRAAILGPMATDEARERAAGRSAFAPARTAALPPSATARPSGLLSSLGAPR